jgi:hypothetical protein
MKLKSRDIEVTLDDGEASIRTPSFDYQVTVGQDPVSPEMALWRYELANIRDPLIMHDSGFNNVFNAAFNIVELTFVGPPLDIKKIVDALESKEYVVDYKMDFRNCQFKIAGNDMNIEINPGAINFVFPKRQAPQELISGFQATRALLAGEPTLTPLLSS